MARIHTNALSLLEVMIGTAILSSILLATTQSMRMSAEVSSDMMTRTNLAVDAGRILHSIAMELRSADKQFIYLTDDDSDSGIETFSYRSCTGFTGVGAPEYGTEGEVTIEYDKDAHTLARIDGDAVDPIAEYLLSDKLLPIERDPVTDEVVARGFDVETAFASDSGDTVYGNRIKLNVTLVSDYGEDTEIRHTASRIVFLRSYLFDSDGLSASLDNEDAGDQVSGDDSDLQYPADYPDEEIPPNQQDPDAPEVTWNDQSPEMTQEQLDAGEEPQLNVEITLKTSGNISIDASTIDINFPFHHNAAFDVTDPQVSPNGKTATVNVSGPRVGSTPITVTAMALDKQGNDVGQVVETNTF